ncbi:MAG: PadR family transcriptional regulator [Candidatus Lokiarchaeota archaeon]
MAKKKEIEVKNLTKFFTLALLRSKNSVTGYSILKRLKSDMGRTASPTYVYDFLNSLKEEGYIEDVPTPDSKRAKGFRLTEKGIKFTDRMFSRFENVIDAAIQSKLKICASCGVQLYDNYHTEVIDGKEMNFCCKHCAHAFKQSH